MKNEYDFLADVSHRISGLSAESKNKLFAIWMSKERLEGSKTLEMMFALAKVSLLLLTILPQKHINKTLLES